MEIHTVVLCVTAPAWQMNTDVSEKHAASIYSAQVTLTFTLLPRLHIGTKFLGTVGGIPQDNMNPVEVPRCGYQNHH